MGHIAENEFGLELSMVKRQLIASPGSEWLGWLEHRSKSIPMRLLLRLTNHFIFSESLLSQRAANSRVEAKY